jgi:predicted amidohydrolase
VRLLLAAIRSQKSEYYGNLGVHLRVLDQARSAGCDLALFPEMSLTGSVDPAMHPERLVALDDPVVGRLAAATGEAGVAACFGVAELSGGGVPRITQVVAAGGSVTGVQRKRHLGEGEEDYGAAARGASVFVAGGVVFGVTICAEAGYDEPFDDAAAAGAGLVLFPAAPGLYGPRRTDEPSWRRGFSWWEESSLGDASRHARRCGLWIAQAGQAGATEDEDFPGLAALTSPAGEVVARLPDWHAGTLIVDIPLGAAPPAP